MKPSAKPYEMLYVMGIAIAVTRLGKLQIYH